MLLELNPITAAIRGQISLNMRQITCMHFGQISCFVDIYLELVGIIGIDELAQEGTVTYGHEVTY